MRLDEAARLFIGIPFRHQGRDPMIGIDCVGLLVLAAQMCDLPQAAGDFAGYGRDPHNGLLESHLTSLFGSPLPASQLRPGDIVTVDFRGATRHVGVVGRLPDGRLSLIHTSYFVGRVTEHGIDAKWMKRLRGVYRVG